MTEMTLSFKQKLTKALVFPLIRFIWMSCKVEVIGQEHVDGLLENEQPFIPCYWHQQHIFCAKYLLGLKASGLKLGFLISPSKDGDIPASILTSMGVKAIRGSSNRTGAKALRDLYQTIKQDGISTVNTPDGPTGPIFKFKTGAVMLSQLSQSPILPIAYRANSAWEFKSWDRFLLPKPFSQVSIHLGEPVQVEKSISTDGQTEQAIQLERVLNKLSGH